MDAQNSPRTTRDALIHELLGDVGQLHDEIKALPEKMQQAAAPALGGVTLAVKRAVEAIEKIGEAEKQSIGRFTAQEKSELRGMFRQAMEDAAGEALASAARTLDRSAAVHQETATEYRRLKWQLPLVAALVGVLAGTVGHVGGLLLYGQQTMEQAEFGRAVSKVWNDLDDKAKQHINAARMKQ